MPARPAQFSGNDVPRLRERHHLLEWVNQTYIETPGQSLR